MASSCSSLKRCSGNKLCVCCCFNFLRLRCCQLKVWTAACCYFATLAGCAFPVPKHQPTPPEGMPYLVAHECLACLDELDGQFMQLVKVVAGITDLPGSPAHPGN